MKWNYRVCKRGKSPVPAYYIHEVYYDDDGNVQLYSADPVTPFGDLPDELYEDLALMWRAFDEIPIDLDEVDKIMKMKREMNK